MAVREAYDVKNEADFEENTKKLWEALDKIRKTKHYKATISEVSRLSGLHRNTISNRGVFVKDTLREIKEIKNKEQQIDKAIKEIEKQSETSIEDKLENAKAEIIFWFTRVKSLQDELDQSIINLNRMTDSRNFYEKEMNKAREEGTKLKEEITRLRDIMKA